jgi:hypothetical protein
VTRTIRPVARSPRVRALAFLAWLLLVVTPAFGAPAGMTHDVRAIGHPAAAMPMARHCNHAAPVKVDRACCGSHEGGCAGHACGCAPCGSGVAVLPSMPGATAAHVAGLRWSLRGETVPGTFFTPPLRPPAA